jgi:hypothetical protein
MPGMSSGLTRWTIAWRSVRERREAAERRRRTFSASCERRRGYPASLCVSMSAEVFELILAAVVAAVLFWIFWRKGKSD